MKSFLKTLSFFSIITLLVLSIALFLITKAYQSRSWKTENKIIRTVFIGDSHIEQAIDDSMSSTILTFAQSGDAYIYTYCKLKKLLQDNPSIDTIILSIDYHNVDLTANEWYSNQGYLNFKFPQVLPFMDYLDIKNLFVNNPYGFLKASPNLFSLNGYLSNTNYLPNYGSFRRNVSTFKTDTALAKSNYRHAKSDMQFAYLDRILELCKAKNKTLICLTTPLHESANRDPYLGTLIESFLGQNAIQYLNCRNLDLDDACFADKFHLNSRGAVKFTKYIINCLNTKKC